MYRILVVDDEKIEREGIKYLLAEDKEEKTIFEASDGKQALNILGKEEIDILLTDIKMPHMDGLELTRRAREKYPDLKIIIFSGYGDFSFAQEAIHYGVTDYILKPVDPEQFEETMAKVERDIAGKWNQEKQKSREKDFLKQYFLQNYLYSGSDKILEKAGEVLDLNEWNKWHCAIMIETGTDFFDSAKDVLEEGIFKELRREFFYLNLNTRQSVLLFFDMYCDYTLVANSIYLYLKREYEVKFHLAVSSKFDGYQKLPAVMEQLEQLMEEKFYHPDTHVFIVEEENEKAEPGDVQDSRLMQKISEDVSRKDMAQLWNHFHCLARKYQESGQFSAMYIKFVFSNVIQELFVENRFGGEHKLEKEIERLYHCSNISQILEVTEENIKAYETFLNRSMSESRDEVSAVKNYIYENYREDLNLESLAEKVYLSSGYLSFIFKKETGMNLNRFIRVVRMEKAKEFLCNTNMKVAQVSEEVGFANVSYFCRSFREYYGSSPESYRKGMGEDEEHSEKI